MSELPIDQWHQVTFTRAADAGQWNTVNIVDYRDDGDYASQLDSSNYADRWHFWQLVQSGEYALLALGSQVPPGTGFWYRHKGPMPPYQRISEKRSAKFTSDISLPLFVGWQMAGNPFDDSIGLDSLSIAGEGCTPGCTIERAADAGLIRNSLWRWDAGEYTNLLNSQPDIETGEAFWLRALKPSTLLIRAPQ